MLRAYAPDISRRPHLSAGQGAMDGRSEDIGHIGPESTRLNYQMSLLPRAQFIQMFDDNQTVMPISFKARQSWIVR